MDRKRIGLNRTCGPYLTWSSWTTERVCNLCFIAMIRDRYVGVDSNPSGDWWLNPMANVWCKQTSWIVNQLLSDCNIGLVSSNETNWIEAKQLRKADRWKEADFDETSSASSGSSGSSPSSFHCCCCCCCCCCCVGWFSEDFESWSSWRLLSDEFREICQLTKPLLLLCLGQLTMLQW